MPKFKEVTQGSGTMDWGSEGEVEKAVERPGEVLTKPGRHPMRNKVKTYASEEQERQARYLRDYGGRDLDARRVPTASQVDSGRTSKSSSKIRFPSRAFRENFDRIFGPNSPRRSHG